MSLKKNRELIREYFEQMYNRGNLDFAEHAWAPHGMLHDPVLPDLPAGPEGSRRHARWARDAAPDLHFEIEDMLAESDLVAVRYKFTGTQQGPILGIAPTGNFATMTGLSLFRIADGRIQESWTHWDVLGMLRNLGVTLPGVKMEAHA